MPIGFAKFDRSIARFKSIFSIGAIGERATCRYLERQTYLILATNVRARRGEVDIVAAHGRTLVFIEVKTRKASRRNEFSGFAAINKRKQARIKKVAAVWMRRNRLKLRRLRLKTQRFDAVEVLYTKTCFGLWRRLVINHISTAM